jgi:multisubunit Na+/H+ antiporter MnhB subunit
MQVLVLVVAAVASVVVYLLMRHPKMRRAQFQGWRAFGVAASLACAVGFFVVFVWLAFALQ